MEKKQFVDDIIIKGALTGILLRSPVVSGLLKEIKTPQLPSNVSLVTAADIPGQKFCCVGQNSELQKSFTVPVFPEKELSWYGQPAAMLVGPDPAKLRELAEHCSVLTEESQIEEKQEIIIERRFSTGDIKDAFEKADKVVEGSYTTGIEDPWPSDPPGAIAIPGQDGSITIHTSTQWPGHIRASVAECLNIKRTQVEVELSRLEIHLDSKVWAPSLLACQAAIGAWRRGKPVKLILKRSEDFLFSPKSAGAEIRIKSAIDKQGSVLGTKMNINVNFGAFGIFAREILDRIALSALGSYSCGSIELEARGYTSSIPPGSPATGFGIAQGFFAAERHASMIAEAAGLDPSEWRKNFFFRKGKKLAIGTEIKNQPPEELIGSAETMSNYRRKWTAYELLRKSRRKNPAAEPLRGIGISLAYQGSSLIYDHRRSETRHGRGQDEGVELTLEKDGILEIRTTLPWGDNQIRIWQALALKILGVEAIRIAAKSEGTRNVPDSGPACLSRSINIITELIEKACLTIRKQRFRDPLPITVSKYYRPLKTTGWAGNKNNLDSNTEEEKIDENAFDSLSWGAAVVEAEVNPVSFLPKVRGMWLSLDGGTILSDEQAKKSIRTASVEALSWAMQERVVYRNGKIDEASINDYALRNEECPPVGIDFLWSEGKSRGIGELPFALIPAAYAQALSQALDYPFSSYPVDSLEIWKAVQNLSAGEEL